MITRKRWTTRYGPHEYRWEGWYLFGFIPLYRRQVDYSKPRS